MASKFRTRKQRHRAKAVLKHGKTAVRKHMRKSGRTGGIWKKRTHGKHAAQGIEARRATTAQQGVVHESPVPKECAQHQSKDSTP